MNPKNSLMRQKTMCGTVRIGHADREEVIMRNRIPIVLALLALILGVTACKPAQAGVAPMPAMASAGAAAPSYAPKEYHDSSWGPANTASTKPVYAPKGYHDSSWGLANTASTKPMYAPKECHDSFWRVTDAAASDPTYAPKEYHDSHWPAAANDR
jgi:hypothetical protein